MLLDGRGTSPTLLHCMASAEVHVLLQKLGFLHRLMDGRVVALGALMTLSMLSCDLEAEFGTDFTVCFAGI